jgi:hypothetical protein
VGSASLMRGVRRLVDRAIAESFQFLVDGHNFRCVPTDDGTSYQSPSLTIALSSNERDGFETHLLFPAQGVERVAVGTILGALRVPKPHDASAHAVFIASNLPKLTALSAEVYRDLAALRFWHADNWRKQWGTGISLDKASVASESARLVRINEFFGGDGAKVA